MAIELPPRGLMTDALIEHLTTALAETSVLVGDGVRPKDAGWAGGQPGQGLFTPSVQVDTLEAAPIDRDTVRDGQNVWKLPYRLGVVGGLRKQADDAADLVRAAAVTFPHGSTSDPIGNWKVHALAYGRLAPVVKSQPTDWPTFAVDDILELRVSRRRV